LKDPAISGPAILAWAVEGCMRWQESGLCVPEVVEKATEQYRLEMDPLRDFIEDRCILLPSAWVASGKLRAAYENWAKENGERVVLDQRGLGEKLRGRGCSTQNRKVDGSSVRGWRGIGLKFDETGAIG
jgi:putative DNA primase/helicase